MTIIKEVAWIVFAFGMFLTFCVIYAKSESFRKALIGALLIGKTFCIVYMLTGLDKTLATLYVINRRSWTVTPIKVTVCEVIIASFIVTTAMLMLWPLLMKHLPKEISEAMKEVQK